MVRFSARYTIDSINMRPIFQPIGLSVCFVRLPSRANELILYQKPKDKIGLFMKFYGII